MSSFHVDDPRGFVEGIINRCIRLAIHYKYLEEGYSLDKAAMEDLTSRLLEKMKGGMHVSELANDIFSYTKGYDMGLRVSKEK